MAEETSPAQPSTTTTITTVPKPAALAPPAHVAAPAPVKKKRAEGILVKLPGQWVCTVKDEKGKNCEGKLKRFYGGDESVARLAGKNAELYRCVECQSIYRPQDPAHDPAARWAEF